MTNYSIEASARREYPVGGWVVYKEFYANGPSLFDWVAERRVAGNFTTYRQDGFARKRDAVEWVRRQS